MLTNLSSKNHDYWREPLASYDVICRTKQFNQNKQNAIYMYSTVQGASPSFITRNYVAFLWFKTCLVYVHYGILYTRASIHISIQNINIRKSMLNGQLASGKRANSFWQLSLDTNWNSLCVYNVGRQARSFDCIDPVLSAFKFIINIGCL